MALPKEDVLDIQLQCFLHEHNEANLHCSDVYKQLAESFPCLTDDDISVPYAHSRSHFANLVQFARLRLVHKKFVEPMHLSGRGYWKLTEAGRADVRRMKALAGELLRELDKLH